MEHIFGFEKFAGFRKSDCILLQTLSLAHSFILESQGQMFWSLIYNSLCSCTRYINTKNASIATMISILNTITATPVANVPAEGQAMKCINDGNGNSDAVYRFTRRKLGLYPTPEIATSWDSNWRSYIQVDCTQIPVSTPMIAAPNEGQAVKCSIERNKNGDSIYRFTKNRVRWYPNSTIANSWDVNWESFITIDCINIVLGQDMAQQ